MAAAAKTPDLSIVGELQCPSGWLAGAWRHPARTGSATPSGPFPRCFGLWHANQTRWPGQQWGLRSGGEHARARRWAAALAALGETTQGVPGVPNMRCTEPTTKCRCRWPWGRAEKASARGQHSLALLCSQLRVPARSAAVPITAPRVESTFQQLQTARRRFCSHAPLASAPSPCARAAALTHAPAAVQHLSGTMAAKIKRCLKVWNGIEDYQEVRSPTAA